MGFLLSKNAGLGAQERFNPDARAAKRDAAEGGDQIAAEIALLALGSPDKRVVPRQAELRIHFENTGKIAHFIKEILPKAKSKSIAAQMLPDAVLWTGTVAVGADKGAPLCKGSEDIKRWRLRDAGRHVGADHDVPRTFHALGLRLIQAAARVLRFQLRFSLQLVIVFVAGLRTQ